QVDGQRIRQAVAEIQARRMPAAFPEVDVKSIECAAGQYGRTAAWAQALYDHADFDGLVWRSRQFNDSYAVMLWGDRVDRFQDLSIGPTIAPLPLYAGAGFDEVQHLADQSGITVI